MVDHLTRVTVERASPRALEIGRVLAGLGFTVREETRRILADSASVEAREVKTTLRALGVVDREYRIHVDFARKWGVL